MLRPATCSRSHARPRALADNEYSLYLVDTIVARNIAEFGGGLSSDGPLLVCDLPFGSYEESPGMALGSAYRAMKEG